jgi:ABC-2 type transport system ATP-binding protein
MDEAAVLADRVGVMDYGKLLALDSPAALMKSVPGGSTLELTTHLGDAATAEQILLALSRLADVERVDRLGSSGEPQTLAVGTLTTELRIRLYVTGDAPLLVAPASSILAEHGAALSDVKLGMPTLEDVFINLTGRALR